jgi:pimeloyl-ACP methyl ester carboxylesterase
LPPLNPARSLFFNVAFRYHEPLNTGSQLPFFSDVQQAASLMSGDLSPFYASVDFVKLAGGKDDNSQIPVKGFMSRILVSHFEPAEGRGTATSLGKSCAQPCIPQFAGRLQPYEIYVPSKTPPAAGYGLTIDLHSADASYARWLGNDRHVEFGERGTGSIVITPNARGLRSGYGAEAGADTFEVWADVARLYKIDADYVSLAGVSMGSMGSFKFAGQFPDLFAALAVSVGCPSDPVMMNHREVPAFIHTGDVDVTTNCHPGNKVLDKYLALNQQYTWWNFLEQPHPFSSRPKSWQPFADFLGMKKRAADPPHVIYAYNADMDEPKYGINSDHAYWVSHVQIRDMNHKLAVDPSASANAIAAAPPYGIIDAFSYGMGAGDRIVNSVEKGKGVYKFGADDYPWPNYNSQEETWGAAPKIPVRNAVTIDPKGARVTCDATVKVDSDGPIKVNMLGCGNVKTVAAR